MEVCLLMCLQSTSSGVVPYLGTYLTVLTMLDTALPDTLEVFHIFRLTFFLQYLTVLTTKAETCMSKYII